MQDDPFSFSPLLTNSWFHKRRFGSSIDILLHFNHVVIVLLGFVVFSYVFEDFCIAFVYGM